jgi:hypothetical protein
MNELFEDGNEDYLPSIDSPGPPEPVYPCFRCGHCCRLWVFLGYEEVEQIMEHTKLSLNEFAIVYWDRSVGPEECLVLKQEDSACTSVTDETPGKGTAGFTRQGLKSAGS